jgi:HEAT repeat protein
MTIMLAHMLFWGGALFAAVCGIALLAWAMFADRSRGRKRCCNCWYTMDHAVSLRCPECGHEVRNERALYRTRRRWKWASAGLLPLLLAAILAVQPKVQRDGWGSVVPATVLILLLRVDDRPWVVDGIQYHITETHTHPALGTPMHVPSDERLWQWQWRLLARSILMRIEDEARVSQRTAYHSWLAVVADVGGDAALRQACMDALARELSHPDANVRYSAAIYSVNYEDIDGSINRAVGLLDHDDSRTRIAGVTSLRIIAVRTGHGVPALIDALEHEDAEVRMSALSAIGSTAKYFRPVPEAFDPVHALEHDDSGDVRYMRVQTLANLQSDDDAWNTIHGALRDEDPHVRRGGLDAAAERHPRPPAVSLLMLECLDDPDADVRQTAAWILPYIDSDVLLRHAEMLESFLNHDDPTVRDAVRRFIGSPGSIASESESESAPESQVVGARRTKTEAVQMARAIASEHGIDLHGWPEPDAQFDDHQRKWWIHFARHRHPGDHFSVTIDDATDETELIRGR